VVLVGLEQVGSQGADLGHSIVATLDGEPGDGLTDHTPAVVLERGGAGAPARAGPVHQFR